MYYTSFPGVQIVLDIASIIDMVCIFSRRFKFFSGLWYIPLLEFIILIGFVLIFMHRFIIYSLYTNRIWML